MKQCNKRECELIGSPEIPYFGNKNADIVICGEHPDIFEERKGTAFSGEKGTFLKSRVIDAGLFGRIMWLNAARCRVDKNEMGQKSVSQVLKNCRPYIEKVLKTLKPKVVLLTGALALQQVLKKKGVKNNRGKWHWSEEFKCWCIATWSPGYIFHKKAYEPEFDQDFRKFVEFIENGYQLPKHIEGYEYKEVDTIEDVLSLAEHTKIICSFDTETQGLDWVDPLFVPISYSISWENGKAYHVQFYEETDQDNCDPELTIQWPRKVSGTKKQLTDVYIRRTDNFEQKLEELRKFAEHPNILKVMQHGSFDIHVSEALCAKNNIPEFTWKSYIADIQAMAHLLDENIYVMANLTQLQYGFTEFREDYNTVFDKKFDKGDMLKIPKKEFVYYSCCDADVTRQAFEGIWEKLKKHKRLVFYYKNFVHETLTKSFYGIEKYGVSVDAERLPDATAEVKKIRDEHEQKVISVLPPKVKNKHREKGLRLTRRDIMRDTLFSEDGFNLPPVKLTKEKMPSADKDSLNEISDKTKNKRIKKIIEEYQVFSEYDMLWSRYLKGYSKNIRADGKIHSSMSLTAASTGRGSSRDPNNMAIPKRSKAAPVVRRLLVADEGWVFVVIDQSQSELRILAHISNDENMISVFQKGDDIHAETASEIVKRMGKRWSSLSDAERKDFRNKAKPVNFGVIYLMSPPGLAAYAHTDYGLDMTVDQAKDWMGALFKKYPKVPKYHENMINFARKHGYVESPLGRRRHLPEITSKENFLRYAAERQAVNFPIQGMSSDMVVLAGNTIADKGFPKDEIVPGPVLFIHDEHFFLVREDKVDTYVPHIVHAMENPPLEKFGIKLKVPLSAEPKIGRNASDLSKYELK